MTTIKEIFALRPNSVSTQWTLLLSSFFLATFLDIFCFGNFPISSFLCHQTILVFYLSFWLVLLFLNSLIIFDASTECNPSITIQNWPLRIYGEPINWNLLWCVTNTGRGTNECLYIYKNILIYLYNVSSTRKKFPVSYNKEPFPWLYNSK